MGIRTRTLFALLTVAVLTYADDVPGLHNRAVRRCDNHTHSEGYGNRTWGPPMITESRTGYASIHQCGGYGGVPCIPAASGSQSALPTANSSYTWTSNGTINATVRSATPTANTSSTGTTLDSPVGASSSSAVVANGTTAQATGSFSTSSSVNASTTNDSSIWSSVTAAASTVNTTLWADWTLGRFGEGGRGPIWTNTTSIPQETAPQSANASDTTETVFIITTDVTSLPAHLTITLHEPVETSIISSTATTTGSVSTFGETNSTLASGVESSSTLSSFSRDFEPVQATSSPSDASSSIPGASSTSKSEAASSTSSSPSESTGSSTIDDTNTSGSPLSSSPLSSDISTESATSANITFAPTNSSGSAAATLSASWTNSTTSISGAMATTSCTEGSKPTGWRDWNATISSIATVSSSSPNSSISAAAPITIPSTGTETIVCINATCSTQPASPSTTIMNATITASTVGNNPNASTVCIATGRPISCPMGDSPWLTVTSGASGTTFSTSIISTGTGGGGVNATATGDRHAMPAKRGFPPRVAWARARLRELQRREEFEEDEEELRSGEEG